MASIAQVLLKKGALRSRHRSVFLSLLDVYVVVGYALMLGSTVVSTIALKVLPLHVTVSLVPLGYIVVVFLSVTILNERMRREQLLGMLIILIGVFVFNVGAV